ncbi:FMN-binding protein [Streptomyces sp. NPDC049915]|uniref:FMN-binding protein n=1 Tax=Streptomyces sp. NPDC049915 TaxID=3155510 RepID=UPI0034319B69
MRKNHPVRRTVLATAATVSGVVLLLTLKPASDPASAQAGAVAPPPAAARQSAQGGTAEGTVTGDVARTQYGAVQVRLTVAGGRITGAEAVQAPKGGHSDQVTAMAVPRLNREAVAAGSADIDAVSGATYTSAGYKQSLQSALDKLGKGGAAGSGAKDGAAGSGAKDGAAGSGAKDGAAGSGTRGGAAGSGTRGGAAGSGTRGGAAGSGTRTVTGETATTQYGPVQVRITVSGGRVTGAEAVQAPKGGLSDQKTALAVPRLNREAVAAGSADIDAVSGATYTSTGYKQSLQSALDKAGG